MPLGVVHADPARRHAALPQDVVFTVEYSIHGAVHAVYTLFDVDRAIPPIYHGLLDPKVGLQALTAMFC